MLTPQEASELRVFLGFAQAAMIDVDPASIRNEKPPLPDISCTIGGTPRFFELGEIVDQDLAADVNTAQKKGLQARGGWFSEPVPLVRMIRAKASKAYVANGAPIDLVLHYEIQSPFKPAEHLKNHESDVAVALRPTGQFSRIWIYDGWAKAIVWSRESAQK